MLGPADNQIERYELLGELATGGMATVYLGRQKGVLGFSRVVAIKSMHPQLAKDPSFRAMFIDEAHLTSRIRHPNVVPTLDIVQSESKLLIIMEYVDGVSLSVLLKAAKEREMQLPVGVVTSIAHDVLEGLHAAHELKDEQGEPLGVVHRDVSPQNILVGVDGIARVVDFGVAKATGRSYKTQTGEIRGKVGYMSPEQMFGEQLDRRVDVYAAGVVFWEALAGERLFNAPTDAALVLLVTRGMVSPPSIARGERLPEGVDQLVSRALAQEPASRYSSTAEMSKALMAIAKPASREEVGRLVRELAPQDIQSRQQLLRGSSPALDGPLLDAESKAVLDVLTRGAMTTETDASLEPMRRTVPLRLSVLAIMAMLSTAFLFYAIYAQSLKNRGAVTVASSTPSAVVSSVPEAAPSTSVVAAGSAPAPPSSSVAIIDLPTNPKGKTSSHKPTGSGSASKPKPDCTVLFTTDAEGHRHYKDECLK